MTRGDQVIWLPAPLEHGVGTIAGINEIGWIEVDWDDHEAGCHPPQHLEHLHAWEDRTRRTAAMGSPT